MFPVILAGGGGTRLWPISRRNSPKQTQPFGDNQTLVQKTFQRLRRGWPSSQIFVATNVDHRIALRRQLPQLQKSQFILEPQRRDTAAAIGLATVTLWKKNPQARMFTASSDHYFKEGAEFVRTVKAIGKALELFPQQTILMGVKPAFAHTGLGYIKMRNQAGQVGNYEVFRVERFIEKPNLAKAEKLIREWQYLWNIGLFAFRVDAMLEKYKRWLPQSYALLMRIAKDLGTRRETATIKRLFPKMEKISIDFGIMEHDRNMLVVPADLTWADIGSWREVHDVLSTRGENVVLNGLHINHDSRGNLIYSTDPKKIIATAHLRNTVIIDTPDALLVIPKERAQLVKELVGELESRALHRHL